MRKKKTLTTNSLIFIILDITNEWALSASFYVTAIPIELVGDDYSLNNNEVILSKTMNQQFENTNFKAFGVNEVSDLIGINITFNNKTYYVKDVVDFGNNLIFLNESLLKKVVLNDVSSKTNVKMLNNNINLIEGRPPQNNKEYIEIVTNDNYLLNEVINDRYLVVGHIQEDIVYLTEDNYRLIYLTQNNHKKINYTKSRSVINLLKINSISITNDYEVLQASIENNMGEHNNMKSLTLASIILLLGILVIVSIVWLILKLYKEISIRVFLKNNILITIKDLILTLLKDSLYLIINSLIISYFSFLVFNYIYNSSYMITFDLLFRLISEIIIIKIVSIFTFYFIHIRTRKLKLK